MSFIGSAERTRGTTSKLFAGGGASLDIGVHLLHELRYLAGPIDTISGVTRIFEPARALSNLKMPILVVMAEASYHAPYDHCTVKYLQQAGVRPSFMRLADIGIKGNSHVMMNEKNNKEIAAVIAQWLAQTLPDGN